MKIDVDRDVARNFTIGMPIVIGNGRRITGARLLPWRFCRVARNLTRWWRPRTVISAVDRDAGRIETAVERWSWRRWRWERR